MQNWADSSSIKFKLLAAFFKIPFKVPFKTPFGDSVQISSINSKNQVIKQFVKF